MRARRVLPRVALVRLVALLTAMAVVVIGQAPTASAQAGGPPVGYLDSITTSGSVVVASGWAFDPDVTDVVSLQVMVDGQLAGTGRAALSRPDVGAAFPGVGDNRGFTIVVRGLSAGPHNVCVWAFDPVAAPNTKLGCRDVTTAAPAPPVGYVDRVDGVGADSIHVQGWTADPDVIDDVPVHIYVDGRFARGLRAVGSRPDVGFALPLYGSNRGYEVTLTGFSPGLHFVCVYALDPVAPTTRTLGCRGIVLSGPGGLAPLGFVDRIELDPSTGELVGSGWAADPDTATSVNADILVDDTQVATVVANQARPDVGAAYPALGSSRGFSFRTAAPAPGTHQVCVRAREAQGSSTIIGCRQIVRQAPSGGGVLAIGDSVMLGAKFGLEHNASAWSIVVDAVVGRHPFQATSIMAGAGAYDRVVVHLGANSPYTTASFDQAMQTLVGAGFAPNEVVWVTIQLPDASYPHEGPTNTVIRQGAARWGARLADWNLLSGANPSYLYFDGIHLTATGASAYTAMVVSALG